MAPHACEGPIGGSSNSPRGRSHANFLVQEICSGVQPEMKEKVWEEWLGFPAMRMGDGRFPLPQETGLGLRSHRRKLLKKYPFGRLPAPWRESFTRMGRSPPGRREAVSCYELSPVLHRAGCHFPSSRLQPVERAQNTSPHSVVQETPTR
jgi:hypothetical protein